MPKDKVKKQNQKGKNKDFNGEYAVPLTHKAGPEQEKQNNTEQC